MLDSTVRSTGHDCSHKYRRPRVAKVGVGPRRPEGPCALDRDVHDGADDHLAPEVAPPGLERGPRAPQPAPHLRPTPDLLINLNEGPLYWR